MNHPTGVSRHETETQCGASILGAFSFFFSQLQTLLYTTGSPAAGIAFRSARSVLVIIWVVVGLPKGSSALRCTIHEPKSVAGRTLGSPEKYQVAASTIAAAAVRV